MCSCSQVVGSKYGVSSVAIYKNITWVMAATFNRALLTISAVTSKFS